MGVPVVNASALLRGKSRCLTLPDALSLSCFSQTLASQQPRRKPMLHSTTVGYLENFFDEVRSFLSGRKRLADSLLVLT
jgi:hypothetical protein